MKGHSPWQPEELDILRKVMQQTGSYQEAQQALTRAGYQRTYQACVTRWTVHEKPNLPATPDITVTITETARALGISICGVQTLLRKGVLHALHSTRNSHYRIPWGGIEALILYAPEYYDPGKLQHPRLVQLANTPNPKTIMQRYMTTQQAATHLGYTVPGVHSLYKRGILHGNVFLKRILLHRQSVIEYDKYLTEAHSVRKATRQRPPRTPAQKAQRLEHDRARRRRSLANIQGGRHA